MTVSYTKLMPCLAAAATLLTFGAAHADSDQHTMDFGSPGDRDSVTRTIEITMGDNYFEPESFDVRSGETILFVIHNEGEFLHEFNLGTAAMHAEHQEEMMTMMEHGMLTDSGINHDMMDMDHSGMDMTEHKHDDPNTVLVEPGSTQELVWTFKDATGLEFACNVPGHYDSGMMGMVNMIQETN